MDALFERMILRYVATFERPAFELRDCTAVLMRAMHQKLSSHVDLATANLHSFEGDSVLNAGIELGLFGGNGQIKINPNMFSFDFMNIHSKSDLDLCMQCISSGRDAVQESLPDVGIENFSVGFSVGLILENRVGDKTPSAHEYLSRMAGEKNSMDLGEDAFKNASQHNRISTEIEDVDAGWITFFNVDRNRDNSSSVLVICEARYNNQSDYAELAAQKEHLHRLTDVFLASIDMHVRLEERK